MRSPIHLFLIAFVSVAASFLVTSVAMSEPIPNEEQQYPVDLPRSCLYGVDDLNAAECCMQSNVDYTWGTLWTKRCCQYNPTFPYCAAAKGRFYAYCCPHASERQRPSDYCVQLTDYHCDSAGGTFYSTMLECFEQCPEDEIIIDPPVTP